MADPQVTTAEDWLKSVFSYWGLPIAVSSQAPKEVLTRLHQFGGNWSTLDESSLSAEQVEALLADGGKTLDALQYLVNATLNLHRDSEEHVVYTVELAGYRERRYLELAQMAEAVALEVRQTGAEVAMDPLPPAERRLIHTLLADEPDLQTHSHGQEPQRRLVVGPSVKNDS